MLFVARKIVLGVIFLLVLAGLIAIARGYRFSPTQKELKSTGILVANSNPDGAKIYVNGKLEGATNSNIILAPGTYNVEIKMDGFTSWQKEITIKGELVLKADALLFPQNPTLSPVTSLGVTHAISSPTGDNIIIFSEAEDIEEDGIYLLENVRNPLSRINPLNMLALKSSFSQEFGDFTFKHAEVEFSPDEDEILLSIYDVAESDINVINGDEVNVEPTDDEKTLRSIYLMDTGSTTTQPLNVTNSVETIRSSWAEEQTEISEKALKAFKKPLSTTALNSFDILSFSPDETRILYTATQSASLPLVIDPPLVATNQTEQTRDIEPGNIYVYDAEEDRNYRIFGVDDFGGLEQARQALIWYPTSSHIILNEGTSISVIDYDGTNKRTVYSGPFTASFLASSKDGRLFILTNFNSQSGALQDIYSVGIK